MRMWLTLTLIAAAPAASQTARGGARDTVAAAALRAHLDFLADDGLEGRGTGQHGGAIAARYLTAEFSRIGLEPAGDSGSYFHAVPLHVRRYGAVVRTQDGSLVFRAPNDVAARTARLDERSSADADAVFVGYGISAPELGWDDYAAADVKGRIVVALAGQPGDAAPDRFAPPDAPAYAARRHKAEAAARHGATALVLLFRDGSVPLRWDQLARSVGEQVELRAETGGPVAEPGIPSAWLSASAAERLATRAGTSVAELHRQALAEGFVAKPLGVALAIDATLDWRRDTGMNVVGRLPGRGPLRHESVVIGAHYDHLGIGPAVAGDSIYNGLADNAVGTAGMLALAEALRRGGPSRRSVVFVGFCAEEPGKLGSTAYVARPPQPVRDIVAMVSIDGLNVWGATRDAYAIGLEYSTLRAPFASAAAAEGLRVRSADDPVIKSVYDRQFYERSDHHPFAVAGVPALVLWSGYDFVGRSEEWGAEQDAAYFANRYHLPDDEWDPAYTLDGALQELRVLARFVRSIADAKRRPEWVRGAPYGNKGADG